MQDVEIMRAVARASTLISQSMSAQEAGAHAVASAKALGFHALNIVATKDGETRVVYSNASQATVREYHERGYSKHDPLFLRGQSTSEPQTGEEIASAPMTPMQRRVFEFIRQKTDCDAALVIPVRTSRHEKVVSTFGGKSPNTGPAARAALTLLGHCVYGRISDLAKKGIKDQGPKTALTARELEVIGWVAKGKCDSEIAIILDMSERTARFHVANVKAKLGAPSRVQAVTKAIDLGLIVAE